jgi:hypothetical protein
MIPPVLRGLEDNYNRVYTKLILSIHVIKDTMIFGTAAIEKK